MIVETTGNIASHRLIYNSNYSGITEREIALLSPFDTEEDQYLNAYCFLRKEKRTFDTTKIISLTNLSSGEIFNTQDFKFQFKPVVRIIKKTVSESGNVYYYEKRGVVSKEYKPVWEKIGRQYFQNKLLDHVKDAVSIQYDNNNEVCYLEWHEKQSNRGNNKEKVESTLNIDKKFQNETSNKNSGCASLLLIALFFTLLILVLAF